MSSGFGLSPAATRANAQGGRGRLMSAKMQHVMGELVDEGGGGGGGGGGVKMRTTNVVVVEEE